MKNLFSKLSLASIILLGLYGLAFADRVPVSTGGTVTSITAGAGLSGGTVTNTGTFTLDLTKANTWTGGQIFGSATSTNFTLTGLLKDSINATGTTGQVLSSTGTSTQWITNTVSGTVGIANGGTNASSFLSPASGISPIIFFDGTKLTGSSSALHLGYSTSTDIVYTRALNISNGGTTVATFTNDSSTQSALGGAGMIGYANPSTAMLSGNRLGFYLFGGAIDTASTTVNSSGIAGITTENWSGTNQGSQVAVYTTQNGTTTANRRTVATFGQDGLFSALFGATVTGQTTLATASSTGLTATNLYSTTHTGGSETLSSTLGVTGTSTMATTTATRMGVNTGATTISATLDVHGYGNTTGITAQFSNSSGVAGVSILDGGWLNAGTSTVTENRVSIQASSTGDIVEGYTSSGTSAFISKSDGKFGVLNSAPSYALDVTGQIRATGGYIPRVVGYTSSSTITVNADTTDIATTTINQTTTFASPTGTILDGQSFEIIGLATTTQTVSWNTIFASSTDLNNITSVASGTTRWLFEYSVPRAKWDLTGLLKTF